MKETYLYQFYRDNHRLFDTQNTFCAGTRQDCWAEINKGAKVIAFGKKIENADSVKLLPNEKKNT